ncbi:hypothetical protein BGZ47_000836 [Haplosporangium gracile]|nr:hypothetical protein BGZ47_000836 [Haplosporangium gracile]
MSDRLCLGGLRVAKAYRELVNETEVGGVTTRCGPWRPSVSQAIPLAHPSFRSLTLRRIAVDEELLLSLVDMCPGLEDLVLDQFRGAAENEIEMRGGRARLAIDFRSIARIRPGMKRFGFLLCVLSATTELVQATIVPLFSEATEWVFPATSILEVAKICG